MKRLLISILLVCIFVTFDVTAAGQNEVRESPSRGIETMTLTFSMTESETGVVGQGIIRMKEYIEEATEGKVDVETYFSSSLIPQDQELESMFKGNLDMNSCWFDWLSPYVPELDVLNVPYIFKDWEHLTTFFASDNADRLLTNIANETGIHIFRPLYYKGMRAMNLTKDVRVTSRSDMKGFKIRMPNSEAWQFMGEALGANPVPMGISDVYLSLQTGVIDGQDNSVQTTKAFSLHEVEKSVTMTGHMIGAGFITMREELWSSMSPELQGIVQEAVELACNYITDQSQAQEADDIALFESMGVKVYKLSSEELTQYRQEVLDYYFANSSLELDMDLYKAISDIAQ